MPRRQGPRFIGYYRVSSAVQGASGLGLVAQRVVVRHHVRAAGGTLLATFTEIESGKQNERPRIAAAPAACRSRKVTLVIAKLDRLARNVGFISGLREAGVDFVACDNPHATRLTIHILAAVAEHEREMISQRTIAALAAARARGVKLGTPRLSPGDTRRATRARTEQANTYAAAAYVYIEAARKAGCKSLGEIAQALTDRGIDTPAGERLWSRAQVLRIVRRAERLNQAA